MNLPTQVARGLVLAYRYLLSPILPPACRYAPSCSEYALTALTRFGAARGTWLALRRIARCHPWGGSGYDPVPEASSLSAPRACDHPTHASHGHAAH